MNYRFSYVTEHYINNVITITHNVKFQHNANCQLNADHYLLYRCRNRIVKMDNWFENTVPQMLPKEFRHFFRMYDQTLANLTLLLSHHPRLHKRSTKAIPIEKKIAMACTYLGTISPTLQYVLLNVYAIQPLRVTCTT